MIRVTPDRVSSTRCDNDRRSRWRVRWSPPAWSVPDCTRSERTPHQRFTDVWNHMFGILFFAVTDSFAWDLTTTTTTQLLFFWKKKEKKSASVSQSHENYSCHFDVRLMNSDDDFGSTFLERKPSPVRNAFYLGLVLNSTDSCNRIHNYWLSLWWAKQQYWRRTWECKESNFCHCHLGLFSSTVRSKIVSWKPENRIVVELPVVTSISHSTHWDDYAKITLKIFSALPRTVHRTRDTLGSQETCGGYVNIQEAIRERRISMSMTNRTAGLKAAKSMRVSFDVISPECRATSQKCFLT